MAKQAGLWVFETGLLPNDGRGCRELLVEASEGQTKGEGLSGCAPLEWVGKTWRAWVDIHSVPLVLP